MRVTYQLLQLWYINLQSVCYKFAIESGQVVNYVEPVCENIANNCDNIVSYYKSVAVYIHSPARTS